MNDLTKMKRRFVEYPEDELNDLIESKDAENRNKVIANAIFYRSRPMRQNHVGMN